MEGQLGLQILWPAGPEPMDEHRHDIVLVHDLGSGPVCDWRHENGTLWPLLLGKDLGNARVFSFGYNHEEARIRPQEYGSGGTVFNFGETLCSDLKDKRTSNKAQPPITFIGHGTGGIIIKSALRYSQARKYLYGSILRKTVHVVFLDTPHMGLEDTSKHGPTESVSGLGIGQLRLWSTVLNDLQIPFSDMAARFNITTAQAYIRDGDNPPGESGRLYLANEQPLMLHGKTHQTICKFAGEDDHNYRRLLERIRHGFSNLTTDPDDIQKIRAWIGADVGSQSEARSGSMDWNSWDFEDCRTKHLKGTCKWLISDPSPFANWASNDASNPILWVTAPVGRGKSVLSCFANDWLSKMAQRPATPYLMISYNTQRTRHQMASSLASQLLEHIVKSSVGQGFPGGVNAEALTLVCLDSKNVENMHDLIRLLVSQCTAVYFFVDGLNELPFDREHEYICKDLFSTIGFLADLAKKSETTRVRLWCSSQRSKVVVRGMEALAPRELAMDKRLVSKDVQRFLRGAEELVKSVSDDPGEMRFAELNGKAGSNFRWAALMKNSLQGAHTPKQREKILEKGLPKSLTDMYSERLKELKAMDIEDQANEGSPLSMLVLICFTSRRSLRLDRRHILSLMTFAKRPLRVAEVEEAVSIIDSSVSHAGCDDLSDRNRKLREDIVHRCVPLVDFVPDARGGHLLPSHGSVVEFLRKLLVASSDGADDDGQSLASLPASTKALVDAAVMADACLKYLFQKRYARMLHRRSNDEFMPSLISDIEDHHFLRYAAKNWYRHADQAGERKCDDVMKFLASPQFLTTIQVQSLFIVGHFINRINYLGQQVMKQNLPEWFRTCDDGRSMARSYETFSAEWSRFLQLGITTYKQAEIRRCFWGALGPGNFLQKHGVGIESHRSFLLTDDDGEQSQDADCSYYEMLSDDGKRLSVWKVPFCSTTDEAQGEATATLVHQHWFVDGINPPFRYGAPETLRLDINAVKWPLYDSQAFPLVPSANCPMRVTPVADSKYGTAVRVGSVRFRRQPGRVWKSDGPTSYWEDIVVEREYTVHSRRKLVKTRGKEKEGGAAGRLAQRGRLSHEGRRTSAKQMDSTHDDELEHEASELDDDELERLGWGAVSSADEQCDSESSDGAESDDGDKESDGLSASSEQEDTDEMVDSEAEGYMAFSSWKARLMPDNVDFDVQDGDLSSSSAVLSVGDSRHDDADADDEGGGDETASGTSDSEVDKERLRRFQPRIYSPSRPQRWSCGHCGKSGGSSDNNPKLEVFYQCRRQECYKMASSDVCLACFALGAWCRDEKHQLRKMTVLHGRVRRRELVSRHDSRPGLDVVVRQRSGNGHEQAVFRFTSRTRAMLYGSPPVVHATSPLLVYAIDGVRFLFASLDDNSYFEHRVPLGSAETGDGGVDACIPVAAQMAFSRCGGFLHVARVTARREPGSRTAVNLFVQVLTVQLAAKRPCSRLPRTLARRRGVALGRWASVAAITCLPFAMTWIDGDVYVSLSMDELRVFKIPLDRGEERSSSGGGDGKKGAGDGEAAGGGETVDCRAAVSEGGEAGKRNETADCLAAVPDDGEAAGGGETADCRASVPDDDGIQALASRVFLPCSARRRPVYFFPETGAAAAKIVLGARRTEQQAEPPAVIYLRADDARAWVAAADAVVSFEDAPLRKWDQLEEFDAEDDCELILSLHDFQR
ncbi:hypothetical protein HRG_006830 [Hirsutella rhossiliensis]|uniref:DUF676 domain-containing protein n=1 Tax=Hirsutella rhossiliensis TaxID=111463 RepID=A0A9P8MV05_9HYPO|nr:uncharacterized protein HRG_06830 [Hirsutella rhossiliensis]KAH0961750.1 hypothetical protein HRG_06830 [Hirsutella rhossiliensis]